MRLRSVSQRVYLSGGRTFDLFVTGNVEELSGEISTFGVQVFDAVPMRMVRLARRERAQLLVEAPGRPALQAFLSAWSRHLWALKPARGLRWHLDVDPAEV